ncbi:hypothetical protein ACN47E_006977 [Coniothyrium glycines]
MSDHGVSTDRHIARLQQQIHSLKVLTDDKDSNTRKYELQVQECRQAMASEHERALEQLHDQMNLTHRDAGLQKEKNKDLEQKMKQLQAKSSFYEERNQELYHVIHALERRVKELEVLFQGPKVKKESEHSCPRRESS